MGLESAVEWTGMEVGVGDSRARVCDLNEQSSLRRIGGCDQRWHVGFLDQK
jgi:hypothetical protein